MTRAAGPFAAPPPKKAPTVKRDTPDEAAEKRLVRRRDGLCVAIRAMQSGGLLPEDGRAIEATREIRCEGPLDVDHVRASGGLGMKSETHRRNMVVLCRWHHKLKTDYGRTWRPLLLAYLERVEPAP